MADRLDLESERIAPERGEVRLRILRELLRGMHVDTPERHGDFVRVTDTLTSRHHERQMLQAGEIPPREFSRPEVAKVLIEAMRQPVA